MSNKQTFQTGAQRDTQANKPKYTLIEVQELARLQKLDADYESDLLDGNFCRAVDGVLRVGADKYGQDNWRKGIPFMRCVDSLYRHIQAFLNGEQDEDHLAHASCNLMFLHWYEQEVAAGRLPASLDDRPKDTIPVASKTVCPPCPGTWNWAQDQMSKGSSVRRVCWSNKEFRIRRAKDGMIRYLSIFNGNWLPSGSPSEDDTTATDWEVYPKDKVGSSEWALQQMKLGKTVQFTHPRCRINSDKYFWKEGKVHTNNLFYPSLRVYFGPCCEEDYMTTFPSGRWEVVDGI